MSSTFTHTLKRLKYTLYKNSNRIKILGIRDKTDISNKYRRSAHKHCIERYLAKRRSWNLIFSIYERLLGAVERQRYFVSFTLQLELINELFGFLAICLLQASYLL